ncbi:MAG: imelysin family protein, partial [Bacteroidota bacterium]
RANGFPAIDFMLYGSDDVLAYFEADSKRLAFLKALVNDMKIKADALVDRWTGNLKTNFVGNGGTQLGSSISVQLNESLVYYEVHVRENKVGIPIGLLGPNDSPIDPDASKIEAYYQAVSEGNENFALELLKATVEEMEDMYLGEAADGTDGDGYEDLLLAREQSEIDASIKAQFQNIYNEIASRTTVSTAGNRSLYNAIQEIVTLYKSDLFPVLNVQDADGKTDGD